MNIKTLHTPSKPVSAVPLFKGEGTLATALQLLQGGKLKEHHTPVPAMLICIEGKAVFENEKGQKQTLLPGTYVHIEPHVKHWVEGIEDSQLILLK